MTIDRAKELLTTQIDFGSGYSRAAFKMDRQKATAL